MATCGRTYTVPTLRLMGKKACLGIVFGTVLFTLAYSCPFWIVTGDGKNIGLWNCDDAFSSATCEWFLLFPEKLACVGVICLVLCCLLILLLICGVSCLQQDLLSIGIISWGSGVCSVASVAWSAEQIDTLRHNLPERDIRYSWAFGPGAVGGALVLVSSFVLMVIGFTLGGLMAGDGAAGVEEEEAGGVVTVQHAQSCVHGEGGSWPRPEDAVCVEQLGWGYSAREGAGCGQTAATHTV